MKTRIMNLKKKKKGRQEDSLLNENIILLNCMIKSQKKKTWTWHKFRKVRFMQIFFILSSK